MADERFSGDMSRNEVEIDLNKFMELVTENSNKSTNFKVRKRKRTRKSMAKMDMVVEHG